MKKYFLTKILYIICIIFVIIPCKAYALDITVGATTWYAWGSRYENTNDGYGNNKRTNNNYAFDPSFLYGPAISVKFNDDFNLTFVYLYSKFDYTEKLHEDYGGSLFVKSNIKRSDSDLTINYKLNDYLKLFVGAKYLGYEIKLSNDDPMDEEHYYSNSRHNSIGPGLGLNCTCPITGNIFILGTISGFYLFSPGEKFEDYYMYDRDRPTKITIGYNEYGINTNISVAYYISQISTVISLGFRYQYFITDYKEYEPFLINNIKNQFFGITLTATYTFSL